MLSEDISVKLYYTAVLNLKYYSTGHVCNQNYFLIQDLGHNYFQNFSAGFFLDHPTDINERKRGNTKCGVRVRSQITLTHWVN